MLEERSIGIGWRRLHGELSVLFLFLSLTHLLPGIVVVVFVVQFVLVLGEDSSQDCLSAGSVETILLWV